MTSTEYAAFVQRQSTHTDRPLAARLGLMAEAGEVAGLFERALRAGQPDVDPDRVADELGDCLFYVALGSPSWGNMAGGCWTTAGYPLSRGLEAEILMLRLCGMEAALESIHALAHSIGLTLQEVAIRNRAKLERCNAEGSIDDRSRRTA